MFFFFIPWHAQPNAEVKAPSDGFMHSMRLSYTEAVTAGVSPKSSHWCTRFTVFLVHSFTTYLPVTRLTGNPTEIVTDNSA